MLRCITFDVMTLVRVSLMVMSKLRFTDKNAGLLTASCLICCFLYKLDIIGYSNGKSGCVLFLIKFCIAVCRLSIVIFLPRPVRCDKLRTSVRSAMLQSFLVAIPDCICVGAHV